MENFDTIKEKGLEYFFNEEYNEWKCSNCDGMICMHKAESFDRKLCLNCIDQLKDKK